MIYLNLKRSIKMKLIDTNFHLKNLKTFDIIVKRIDVLYFLLFKMNK